MIIRRVFANPGTVIEAVDRQVIATFDTDSGEMIVGVREHNYDEWSTPLTLIAVQDDGPGRGPREYATGGREYGVHDGGTDEEVHLSLRHDDAERLYHNLVRALDHPPEPGNRHDK